jgi:hypothetical protein
MKRTNQPALRAAILLHERLVAKQQPAEPPGVPYYAWNNIQQIQRQIGMARQRGWHGAANRLNKDLTISVADCRCQLEATLRSLEAAHRGPCRGASVSDIYHDLKALQNEFADVEIDVNEHAVSVTTDAIALEDVLLGRFQIRLDWYLIEQVQQPYRVVAIDPHPAAKRSDVTHPHVLDEQLCEGEGRPAIAAALRHGRLYDFFLLLSQVLHTYGRGQAYVELSRWNCVPCSGCGTYVDPDRCVACDRCGDVLCNKCAHTCQACDKTLCFGCRGRCAVCRADCCPGCLAACPQCRRQVCARCRQGGMCTNCHETLHPQEPQEEPRHDPPDEPACEAACLAGQGD